MSNINLVQTNGTAWTQYDIEFSSVTGGSGTRQAYRMYDATNSQYMTVTQGASTANFYDIERGTSGSELNVWYDVGTDSPKYFLINSSTAQPTGGATAVSSPSAATSTTPYLHIWTNVGNYLGYMDVWTPFQGNSGNTGTESFDPIIENVVFTKTSDTTVSITFDWSNLTTFNLVKNGTATAVTPPSPLGTSHTISSTTVAHNDVLYIEYTDVDGFVVQAGLKYTHKFIEWSIAKVNGVKTVFAKYFGVDTGNTYDHIMIAFGPSLNLQGVEHTYTGSEITKSMPYKAGSNRYYIQKSSSGGWEDYGNSYTSPISKVFSNFW